MKIFADKPLSIKESWSAIFKLFAKTFPKVWPIALALGIVSVLFRTFGQLEINPMFMLIGMVTYILLSTYIGMLLLHRIYIVGEGEGKTTAFVNSCGFVWKKLPKMLGAVLLAMIVLVGLFIFLFSIYVIKYFGIPINQNIAIIAITIFSLSFIILAWYVLTLLMLTPLVLFDDQGVFGTLKSSYKMIWGNWWYTFIVVFPGLVLAGLSTSTQLTLGNNYWVILVEVLLNMLFYALLHPSILIQFGNLKARKAKVGEVAQVL